MRQVFGIVRYNFFGFLRNPKVVFIFLLEFVLSFLLTGRIMVVMETYDTPVQAIEPFIWTFGDGIAVLSSSLLLLLMFSDLPKMTPITPYQLTRTTKRKWLLGQFIYVILVTVLYTVLMLLFTAVLLSLIHISEPTLSFVILVGNLYKGKTKGMIFGLLYSVFGFLLDPKVLAAILHKEKYEMYQVNVLICWISPLNQAVYGKHNLGYDPLLPKITHSYMFFLGILVLLAVFAINRMKKYTFEFLGEKT